MPITHIAHIKIEVIFGILVGLLGISSALDVLGDLYGSTGSYHVFFEVLVAVCAVTGLIVISLQALSLRKRNVGLEGDLKKVTSDAAGWQAEAERFISGLSLAIDAQLVRWGFTEAESDIARLLLKGLSLKEIADARGTTERTVRQQTLAIYSKSGLAGRAELSAFFLEDLLAPIK